MAHSARRSIRATLYDGRTVASNRVVLVCPQAGNYAFTVQIVNHRTTERVLEYNRSTNPTCDPGTPTGEKITGNVVGVTLIGVGAGTTLTVDVLAEGL
jgi:hypothetical protein